MQGQEVVISFSFERVSYVPLLARLGVFAAVLVLDQSPARAVLGAPTNANSGRQ